MSALSWGPFQLGALGNCLGCLSRCGVSDSSVQLIWIFSHSLTEVCETVTKTNLQSLESIFLHFLYRIIK